MNAQFDQLASEVTALRAQVQALESTGAADRAQIQSLEAENLSVASNLTTLIAWSVVLNARLDLLESRQVVKPSWDEIRAAVEAMCVQIGDKFPIPAEAVRAELVRIGFLPEAPPETGS